MIHHCYQLLSTVLCTQELTFFQFTQLSKYRRSIMQEKDLGIYIKYLVIILVITIIILLPTV
jgi:hypothetical protein